MNITPQPQSLPIATAVNVQTDALRRENNLREVITKPEAASQSAAEKGVASERERAKTPGQSQEGIDFEALRKHAEENDTTINDNANKNQQRHSTESPEPSEEQSANASSAENENSDEENNERSGVNQHISEAELKELQELQARDREVRAHEQAHANVGGSVAGAPTYTYEVGADGRQYAVSGEVSVDLSAVNGDPVATIAKMEKVKAAALAPASPSGQDLRVAATATQRISQEQIKIALELNNQDAESESPAKTEHGQVKIDATSTSEDEDNQGIDKEAIQEALKEAEEAASERTAKAFEQFNSTLERVNVFSKQIDVDFNALVGQGLSEKINNSTQRSDEINERAGRIENHYQNITQAYSKPPSYQFNLVV